MAARRRRKGVGRYGNVKKPVIDGIRFDSQREGHRYLELRTLERAGLIHQLECQYRIPIVIGGVEVRYPPDKLGRRGHALAYVADFRYFDENGAEVIEDVKMQSGHRTATYRIKRALLLAMGIEILET